MAAEDYCGALPYYAQGLLVVADENVSMTATAVYNLCYPPEPTADPNASEEYYEDTGDEYTDNSEEEYYEEDVEFYDSSEGRNLLIRKRRIPCHLFIQKRLPRTFAAASFYCLLPTV